VDADYRFADMAGGVKAVIAQTQTELVFTFGVEAAVTSEAGGIFRVLVLFGNVNFGMDFERYHINPPVCSRQPRCQIRAILTIEDTGLIRTRRTLTV
jgi:hypothetical protein